MDVVVQLEAKNQREALHSKGLSIPLSLLFEDGHPLHVDAEVPIEPHLGPLDPVPPVHAPLLLQQLL